MCFLRLLRDLCHRGRLRKIKNKFAFSLALTFGLKCSRSEKFKRFLTFLSFNRIFVIIFNPPLGAFR